MLSLLSVLPKYTAINGPSGCLQAARRLLIAEESLPTRSLVLTMSTLCAPTQAGCPHSSAFWISGSDFPALEVQHHICYQDCCGASQPLRAAQDAGRSAQGQQELSVPHHQGRPEACSCQPSSPQLSGLCCLLLRVHQVPLICCFQQPVSGLNPCCCHLKAG